MTDSGFTREDAVMAANKIDQLEDDKERMRKALEEIKNAPKPKHWSPQFQHVVDIACTALEKATDDG